ncbi:MAG: 2-oxo acid dehydrogenase subunit E2 [Acidimicrobiaceae bacterium]|nr:2-oxo acid dehydrogenase subunit E2 [Acidimicrobiaceae bacterium]
MSEFEFRMPDIGEGIAEAELVTWYVKVGDAVEVDQLVAEVMTDKATTELPSVVRGTVSWLGASPGDRINVGSPLIRFLTEGEVADTAAPSKVGSNLPPSEPIGSPEVDKENPANSETEAPSSRPQRPISGEIVEVASAAHDSDRPLASPAVRRRAMEANLDLRLVTGTGPAGRIGHDDLDRYISGKVTHTKPPTGSTREITDIPVIGLRRTIAERMSNSKAHIPHITYVEEVDVTEVERLRKALNEKYKGRRPKLTLLPFLVRAMVSAIQEQPELNARYDDEAGVIHQYGAVHIGIATQTQKGLVVPVLHDAQSRDIWGCAEEIKRLSDLANGSKLEREDLSGSTITITSLGALGGLVSTPIINYPEVAVIGVNKMQVRPVWDGRDFAPRNMMNLSSGFDHRIIDGWNAATFIQRIKSLLEEPAMIFIDGV